MEKGIDCGAGCARDNPIHLMVWIVLYCLVVQYKKGKSARKSACRREFPARWHDRSSARDATWRRMGEEIAWTAWAKPANGKGALVHMARMVG